MQTYILKKYLFLIKKDRIVKTSKNIMFYFYFEPIVGSGVGSESICLTGECSPELAILTAQTTLLFRLGIPDHFLKCFHISLANLFSHRLSSINAIFCEVKASVRALWSLLTFNSNFRTFSIKAAFVSKSDNSPVFSRPPFFF